MKNERITEDLIVAGLEASGMTPANGYHIEKQLSANPLVTKLLKAASKSGAGMGRPEFVVTKDGDHDFLIVVECKADTKWHSSAGLDQPKEYAVDGALLYAGYLAREFDVIAIGASGQSTSDLRISTYLHPKGASTATPLSDENGVPIAGIISWDRYKARAIFDPARAAVRHADLMRFSRELHNYMRDYAKITEAQKPLLVSGVLIALMDKGFERAYSSYDGSDLAQKTYQAVRDNINKAQLGDNQEAKKRAVENAFSFIEHHPELQRVDAKKNESPLLHIVRELHTHVQPFTRDHYDFDIIGNFYGEFIRYTGGDGKGLGIVLTPKHITDLFADLAKLNKNSVVLDICCGTGGFLISAMKKMTEGVSADERRHILEHSLIGIEQEPQMFALAVSNMILRGDGKTNLYQGSCFDDTLFGQVKDKASVGFINPPYSQKGESLHEWDFILHMLDGLQKNAIGIAIVPMSLAIAPHSLRERVLREHRLEAVMSMPDDLFYPVGVVTCIMVFTAHVPHESDKHHESWFGYWKDDGFRKDKVKGRIPTDRWAGIKEEWLEMFRRTEAPGRSVWKRVEKDEEWCAEAYLETPYDILPATLFLDGVKRYIAFRIVHDKIFVSLSSNSEQSLTDLSTAKWEWFQLGDLFEIKKGKRLTKEDMRHGETPFIGSTELDNGVTAYIDEQPIHKGNTISVTYNGSVAEAFYQPRDFWATDDVNVLYPKFDLNPYIAMFLIAIIRKEKYRYNYGRKWHLERMRESKIKLPVDPEGKPDWKFMEEYIKSLPYSSGI